MQYLTSLRPIADTFDALLLDLWGCVHDGTHLYPGALHCIERAHAAGKRILFLSNAPRRAAKAQAVLDQLGVARSLYEAVVTSGEVAYLALAGGKLSPGKRYYFLGAPHDAVVLDGLPFTPVTTLAEADFILNCGFSDIDQSDADWSGPLGEAASRGLPMLCLNPDLEVVKLTGERFPCAGVLARDYEALGGRVDYFGKPYGAVYAHCKMLLGLPRSRVLAVGDGLHTDVLGARRAGIPGALVTGGIMKQTLGDITPEQTLAFLAAQDVQPDYVLPGLIW